MMDPREIIRLSEEAARRAERENLRPRVYGTQLSERVGVLREHVKHMPNLGAYRPQGWELVEREELKLPPDMSPARLKCLAASEPYLMVDSCGLGARDEPALLFDELVSLVAANPDVGWAIVETGQFQVVVGVFRKVGDEARPPKLYSRDGLIKAFAEGKPGRSHNAMSDGRQYILHATPICTRESEGVGRERLVFNWGGWHTPTTRRHMAYIMQQFGLRPDRYIGTPGEEEKMGRNIIRINLWEEVPA